MESGAVLAEAGTAATWLTLGPGLAAAMSVTVLAATARAAVRGEATPIETADRFYGTGFGDIYAWQERSLTCRVSLGVLTLGTSELWHALNRAIER